MPRNANLRDQAKDLALKIGAGCLMGAIALAIFVYELRHYTRWVLLTILMAGAGSLLIDCYRDWQQEQKKKKK
jgi:hypothetical protein